MERNHGGVRNEEKAGAVLETSNKKGHRRSQGGIGGEKISSKVGKFIEKRKAKEQQRRISEPCARQSPF